MSSVKEKPMKRKLFASEQEEKSDSNAPSAEKKKRRKNAVETPKHYPKSERQQLAMVLQMTSVENSPESASSPPPNFRKTPGGSGRKDKVHKRNERGETLLHLFTIRGDLEAMKELIKQGADVNVQDFAGWTPLHEACNHGHQEITRYLLQVGANVNSKGLEDDTPLHDAVTNSHRDLVELLLKHGANPLLKNKRGERPLDIAEDQVIRQLMQKEIILSDEESDIEPDCSSPSRSEDSLGSRKILPKERTTSTSSSGFQDLFESEKKKKHNPKSALGKSEAFLPYTSDTSSDSDSSDDQSIVKKEYAYGLSSSAHLNGIGNTHKKKMPTVSASSLKTPKLKKKWRSMDKSGSKSQNIKIPLRKSSFEDLSLSSSGTSSDSDHRTQQKDKNGTLFPQRNESKISSLGFTEKKDHTKQKSLYSNGKLQFSNRNVTQETEPSFKKKLPSQPNHVKRIRSFSSDVEKSNPKFKSDNLLDENTKFFSESVATKMNGFQDYESLKMTEEHTEGSVYDFSLSAEDLTDTSAISLKRIYEDKSSELFDIVCLGKMRNSEPESEKDSSAEGSELAMPKPLKLSQDKSAVMKNYCQDVESSSDLKEQESLCMGHTHNKFIGGGDKVVNRLQNQTQRFNGDTHSQNHVPSRVKTQPKDAKVNEKPVVIKSSGVSPTCLDANTTKQELKLEKKMKRLHSISESPKKPLHNNGPTALIKSDALVKQESMTKEMAEEGKMEKQKKPSFEGEARTPLGERLPSGLGSIKKKKKHKHRHSRDMLSSEHKHRQKVTSTEMQSSEHKHRQKVTTSTEPTFSEKFSTSEKDKSSLAQPKPLLKRVDLSKSQHVIASRKISLESKPEGTVVPAAKKKARSTDSNGSDASIKSAKHSGSVNKVPKLGSTGPSQERPTTTKKEKQEAKKIALVSDANSSFFSELEKSSKQRQELERRLKLQRKKKLQQKQRLKAQSDAETASIESNKNRRKNSTAEKSMASFPDKVVSESNEFADATRMRVPPQSGLYDRPQSQTDLNYPYMQNFVNPFYEHTNSLDLPVSGGDLNIPSENSWRSISHIDPRGSYHQPQEIWNRDGPRYTLPHEKKHPPVHRSLSFSAQQPLHHKGPRELIPHPDGKNTMPPYCHGGIPHRHSTGEVPHNRLPSDPGAPANIPQPHSVNGPLVHPGNHLHPHTTVSHVPPSSHPMLQKPASNFPETSQPIFRNPETSSSSNLVTDITSNVPISSPMVASKVPAHPVVATPTCFASSMTDQAKEDTIPEASVEEGPRLVEDGDMAERRIGGAEDPKTDQENKEPSIDEQTSERDQAENSVNKEEVERKAALEKYIKDRLSKLEVIIEEPKPKRLPVFIPIEKLKNAAEKDPIQDRLNVYEEWAVIQRQVNEKRKKYYTAVVIPQAPHCYCDYMTYTGAYLLSGNRESWLSVPVLAPPPSLAEEMRALFVEHEKERVKLRLQHATQREKLIVACEQEIMRVHSRAARMLQNQQIPLSACSVLLDREIYNLERRNKKVPEDSNGRTSIRDRFNGRMMLSWLQDVDDKYVKQKNVLLARQRHEAQALHAVQRTEWFLKLQEVENQGQQKRWSNSKPEDVSELYVPLVNISDDFDLLPG